MPVGDESGDLEGLGTGEAHSELARDDVADDAVPQRRRVGGERRHRHRDARFGVLDDVLDRLVDHVGEGRGVLAREGISVDMLVEAGLMKASDDDRPSYDLFFNRVMFPIRDRQGRIISFGGRILGEICHFVDALTYLSGSLPIEAQATAATGHPDAVSILLRFADGSVGTILYTSLGDASVPKEYLEAFANGRVVQLDDFNKLTIHAAGKSRTIKGSQDKGQAQLVAAFLEAAKGKAPAPIPLNEIEAVTRATLAIEDALRGV